MAKRTTLEMLRKEQIFVAQKSKPITWFSVLSGEKIYSVRIDPNINSSSCDCLGDVYRQGGRNQKECRHIKFCREWKEHD